MDFKEWLQLEEDATLIETELREMFTQAGTEMGSAVANSLHDPKLATTIDSFYEAIKMVEQWVGMRKFLSMLPKFAYAEIMFAFSIAKFIKNPLDKENQEQVLHWLVESVKLSFYSGATIPLAVVIGNIVAPGIGGVVAGALAKVVSYGYFYLGQWADNMKDNPTYGQFATQLLKALPKTVPLSKPKISP